MATSLSLLRTIYPEFETTPSDEVVSTMLELAAGQISANFFGALYQQAAVALAAHMLAVRKRSVAAASSGFGMPVGGLTAMSTGDESVSFGAVGAATANDFDTSLRTTPYGLEFLRIKAMIAVTPITI